MHIKVFLYKLVNTLKKVIDVILSVKIGNSDNNEFEIESLLKTPSDNETFQKAIDELIKSGQKSKKIILNNKEVEISI